MQQDLNGTPSDAPARPPRRSRRRWRLLVALAILGLAAALLVREEVRRSRIQAWLFTRAARGMSFEVGPGPAPALRFPDPGPYDLRLGYARLPLFLDRLRDDGWTVTLQARQSDDLQEGMARGLFAIYHEPTSGGLTILDRSGRPLFSARYPRRTYATFEDIPPAVVAALLFIENRELLEERFPRHNPAVEWDRFALAVLERGTSVLRPDRRTPGGSTLATQLEKFRHSPGGVTGSAREKLRQMISASLRVYLDGERTGPARRRIVLDYVNSIPLAAAPGHGEVNGLGDGLWVWYGEEFDAANRRLADPAAPLAERALTFKRALSLFVAHKRPSVYLRSHRDDLRELTDSYLRLLAAAGLITAELRDAALPLPLGLRSEAPGDAAVPRAPVKAAATTRARLLPLLGVDRVYELDRLDLTATTTLDARAQQDVTELLTALADPARVAEMGLREGRLLSRGDPSQVVYSFTLYERADGFDRLRVQADSLDQPLNINEGVKLELGSTAKLRTLVSYLEIVAELHAALAPLPASELRVPGDAPSDRLTRWAREWLLAHPGGELAAMLEAAMQRRYSASPDESFFTGGGMHRFANFDSADDGRVMDIWEAFRNSVNLPFIRLMRDVVAYHAERVPGAEVRRSADPDEPRRQEYLRRFADREGRQFVSRFYRKYAQLEPAEILPALIGGRRPSASRLAVIFRSVRPTASRVQFADFLAENIGVALPESELNRLYDTMGPDRYDLADRGYLARIHPLELWVAGYLFHHPGASLADVVDAGADERQEVYRWLFDTSRRGAQDVRIRTLVETEAFLELHRSWQRVGYPFASLVPSYATAIGSSGDRPAALADLVGILLSEGVRYPDARLTGLHFASGTPFETALVRPPPAPERVLPPEVAAVALRALRTVVAGGTAQRAARAVTVNGEVVPVGGKTGTGDNQYPVYGSGGRLLDPGVLNRTATFTFFIGDRFFGVVTAYVEGPRAREFRFTSALPVRVFTQLVPAFQHLLDEGPPLAAPEALAAAPPPPAGPVAAEAPREGPVADPDSPAPVVPAATDAPAPATPPP